jgi:hypothetical protein
MHIQGQNSAGQIFWQPISAASGASLRRPLQVMADLHETAQFSRFISTTCGQPPTLTHRQRGIRRVIAQATAATTTTTLSTLQQLRIIAQASAATAARNRIWRGRHVQQRAASRITCFVMHAPMHIHQQSSAGTICWQPLGNIVPKVQQHKGCCCRLMESSVTTAVEWHIITIIMPTC